MSLSVTGLGEGIEGTFSQPADDTKLGEHGVKISQGKITFLRQECLPEVVSKIKNKDLEILPPVCFP